MLRNKDKGAMRQLDAGEPPDQLGPDWKIRAATTAEAENSLTILCQKPERIFHIMRRH